MTQASRTSCDHNATGQVVRSDISMPCRKCGAQIQATSRTVNVPAGSKQFVASEKQVNAIYPADSKTADSTWAFAQ